MQTDTHGFTNIPAKLIAAGVIAMCLVLGFAGLILPLIPGLLFLAVAAIVAAKLSPRFAGMLRQNATLRSYLDRTDGLVDLPLGEKAKVMGLLAVKALIDGVEFLVTGVVKVVKAAERA